MNQLRECISVKCAPQKLMILSGLTSLQELDMDYNRITDLSPLSDLTNLKIDSDINS